MIILKKKYVWKYYTINNVEKKKIWIKLLFLIYIMDLDSEEDDKSNNRKIKSIFFEEEK